MNALPPSIHPSLAVLDMDLDDTQLRRRMPPMTCTRCAITFIHLPEPTGPASDHPEDATPWVCHRCTA